MKEPWGCNGRKGQKKLMGARKSDQDGIYFSLFAFGFKSLKVGGV